VAITWQYDSDVAAHIPGEYDKALYKIVKGTAVLKTEIEQTDYQYNLVKDTIPPPEATLTDALIDQYFYGKVDVQQWKKEHYAILRKRSYPPIEELIDAQVKLHSGEKSVADSGQAQIDAYVQKCLEVKQTYSKPQTKEKHYE
jgi:hypothetical protein